MKAKSQQMRARSASAKLKGTQPITRELTQILHEQIQSGAYQGALPSEWKLAEEFGVSRSSARLCTDQLVREGLLYRVPGKGTFVVPTTKGQVQLRVPRSLTLLRRLVEEHRGLIRGELPQVDVQWVDSNDPGVDLVSFIGSHLSARSMDLLPLDSLARKDLEQNRPRFRSIAEDAFRWNGIQYALPLGFSPMVLNYHRGLFREAGIAEPTDHWKWSDLLDAAHRLTDKEHNRFGFGIAADPTMLLMFFWQCGGELRDPQSHEERIRTPEFRKAMEFFLELTRLSPPEQSGTWQSAMDAAHAGHVAMLPHGFRLGQSLQGQGAPSIRVEDWGVVRFPAETVYATRILSEGAGISAKCEHVSEAWQLIRLLAGSACQNSLDRADCHLLPANNSVRITLPDAQRALGYTEGARLGFEHLPLSLNQDWRNILRQLMHSEITIEVAQDQFKRAARKPEEHHELG